MAKQVMPAAVLEQRPSDVKLTEDQYLKISLFAKLKRKPTLDKYPGALVVRRYFAGDVICRQGEAGWTAFYVLTSEDVLALRLSQLQAAPPAAEEQELRNEVTQLSIRLDELQSLSQLQIEVSSRINVLRKVATVHLAMARRRPRRRRWWRDLFRPAPEKARPLYIPVDGPRDVDYDSLEAAIHEGEVFGEMSCLYRSPRSGTVVAARDCYLLEMLRNVLDMCQKDEAYKAEVDRIYRQRVLQLHLRNLPLFADLTEKQFEAIREEVQLITVEAGEPICDEHERSDALYLVRSGLVRVIKGVTSLLSTSQVRDWAGLVTMLREGAKEPEKPAGRLWQQLSADARTILERKVEGPQMSESERDEVIQGLNTVIKDPKVPDFPEFKATQALETFKSRATGFPAKRADWTPTEVRRYNRLLVDASLPNAVRSLRRASGPERVLYYASRGEVLGEMGVLSGQPRSASCLAFGHPQGDDKGGGRAEVVVIPAGVVHRLLDESPALRAKVEKLAAERRRQQKLQTERPVTEEAAAVQVTEKFAELGLVQGQRLMLVDLDRCTRCDECVRACVNTHDDGRSRLYLDGPRFGRYLIPTTCRSCLDPVCMIGCPVGSIHRGDNGQITIEDWCIGCELCADQCPYGSILMHDLGIIPENALGWRYMPATLVSGDGWMQRGFGDGSWLTGRGPFRHDREFLDSFRGLLTRAKTAGTPGEQVVYFRYHFQLEGEQARRDCRFRLEMVKWGEAPELWLNGKVLQPDKPPQRGKSEYSLTGDAFRSGHNVLAAKVPPPSGDAPRAGAGEKPTWLRLRLDEIRRPETAGDVEEKLVTERAVVCDLCSDQAGQVPACVNACPHDAAMRVDARFQFPSR
jgi:Fe-S-cluster-containing hydrogenase component 2/CRP-like cAMP-binding protein